MGSMPSSDLALPGPRWPLTIGSVALWATFLLWFSLGGGWWVSFYLLITVAWLVGRRF